MSKGIEPIQECPCGKTQQDQDKHAHKVKYIIIYASLKCKTFDTNIPHIMPPTHHQGYGLAPSPAHWGTARRSPNAHRVTNRTAPKRVPAVPSPGPACSKLETLTSGVRWSQVYMYTTITTPSAHTHWLVARLVYKGLKLVPQARRARKSRYPSM